MGNHSERQTVTYSPDGVSEQVRRQCSFLAAYWITCIPEAITHYQRVTVTRKETMRSMDEVNEVVDGHGGWPIE
jgi:hypothetical protein